MEGLLLDACVDVTAGVPVVTAAGVLVPCSVAVAAGVVDFVAVAVAVAVGVGVEEGGPLEGSLVWGNLLSRALISLMLGTAEKPVMVTIVNFFEEDVSVKGTSSKL